MNHPEDSLTKKIKKIFLMLSHY